jgi:monoamine oxidase
MSFAAYLRSKGTTDAAFKTASVWTRAMLGQEPENISALFFLNYCKAGGGLLQMRSDRKGGGQHLRIKQGTQSFSRCLAAELPEGVLQLSSPVASIWQAGSQKAYVQAGGRTYVGRKIISALPQPVLKTIAFEPALPLDKQILIDSYRYGHYKKVMVVFKEPFWVKKGYCGLIQSFRGPAAVIRDTSIPEVNKWVLTCFVAGDPGKEWSAKPKAEAEAILLQQISDLYGEPEAEKLLVEMIASVWENEPFSGHGGPSPSLPPGVLDSVGHALRARFGNIHFAGTETSDVWKGYMEGAVRSGERAAEEVIGDLAHVVAKL